MNWSQAKNVRFNKLSLEAFIYSPVVYTDMTEEEKKYEALAKEMIELHCNNNFAFSTNMKEFKELLNDCHNNKSALNGILIGIGCFEYVMGNQAVLASTKEARKKHKLFRNIARIYAGLASKYLEVCV